MQLGHAIKWDGSTGSNKIESPELEERTNEETKVGATVQDEGIDKVSTMSNDDEHKATKESTLILLVSLQVQKLLEQHHQNLQK